MIHTSLSPNVTFKDILLALSYFIFPWKWMSWRKGKFINRFENNFKRYLEVKHVSSFDSGRSALLAILKALEIKEEDEVLLQAYTCVVVPNAVLAVGAKPVYVDVELNGFNLDARDLESKITPLAKAVIIQNTFGVPADYKEILRVAKKHKLKIIEDCAHSLGAEYNRKKIGTIGDVSFFSFGRDKMISCVFGGITATNNPIFGEKLTFFQKTLPYPNCWRVLQNLLHPIVFAMALPIYNCFNLGKGLIVMAQKLKIISLALGKEEKRGKFPNFMPAKLPNALCEIALHQLELLERFNAHRKKIALFYLENLKSKALKLPKLSFDKKVSAAPLRYTILSTKRNLILSEAKKQRIYLGDWYDWVIAPKDVDLGTLGYKVGMCPVAEKKALLSFNLPTHRRVSLDKAKQLVEFVNRFDEV